MDPYQPDRMAVNLMPHQRRYTQASPHLLIVGENQSLFMRIFRSLKWMRQREIVEAEKGPGGVLADDMV